MGASETLNNRFDGQAVERVMNQLTSCGHRYGSLRFEAGGMRCPTCGRGYPWGIPLQDATCATAGR